MKHAQAVIEGCDAKAIPAAQVVPPCTEGSFWQEQRWRALSSQILDATTSIAGDYRLL